MPVTANLLQHLRQSNSDATNSQQRQQSDPQSRHTRTAADPTVKTYFSSREATHILHMTEDELSHHLGTVEDTTLPMTHDSKQHNTSTQLTENATVVTDHDNVLQQQQPSRYWKQPSTTYSTTGSSLATLQQQANMQTINSLPQLLPLVDQQTFNNHSEQPQISNSSQHSQLTIDNMLPELVYTSKYHQPTFDIFVTHNPAYSQTAYEMRSYDKEIV